MIKNKILSLFTLFFLLSGCVETVAILAPLGGADITRSAIHSSLSYGVKNKTGKAPMEHALSYVKEKNNETKDQDKFLQRPCSQFNDDKDTKLCKTLKNNIKKIQSKINHNSKIRDLRIN